jgi:hypothetical protein
MNTIVLTLAEKSNEVLRAKVDRTLTHVTDSLIGWSPNEWPSVFREIPVSADKMFWTPNKSAQWALYITQYLCPIRFRIIFITSQCLFSILFIYSYSYCTTKIPEIQKLWNMSDGQLQNILRSRQSCSSEWMRKGWTTIILPLHCDLQWYIVIKLFPYFIH